MWTVLTSFLLVLHATLSISLSIPFYFHACIFYFSFSSCYFPTCIACYFLFHASVLNRNYFSTDSIICPCIPVILFLVGFLLPSLLYNIIPPIKVQFFLCCVYTLIQSSTGFLSLLLYLYSLPSLLFPFISCTFHFFTQRFFFEPF